ncbi:hypothetical protein AvCA_20960 [Azotobacter vinelandii CA]|uniref:Uncharacterized protein n=2 Tax=Azotobacter vinelandii TaxID=354 RepID=C1DF94_AZOVD|nr:hypothetical protein Avin_20960 [Azotobacter vinelandii DJ]AGK15064.1 hypothetical protein AvCA_20960 [Azotobacter vinelandii CA]AGK20393.1 hypothetical protein AvCA6_20960 [Azotobacter vinelandii CA6]
MPTAQWHDRLEFYILKSFINKITSYFFGISERYRVASNVVRRMGCRASTSQPEESQNASRYPSPP